MCIIFVSRFVWNIEVTGNETIPTDELIKSINDSGLKTGEYKSKIDIKKITNDLRLNRSDLAWVGISIKGTNAIVKVVEADIKPDILDENEYCSIVADKDGVIEKVNANNGTIQVQKGDVVKKGTVLISGWIEGKYTGVRYVHSSGEVVAKVWYSQKAKVELKQTIKEKTGNEEKKYSISI